MLNFTSLTENLPSGFLEEIRLASVRPSRFQLRNEITGIEDLARSIEQNGLLQPVVVRPIEDAFELVAGSRRLAACSKLGWSKIPCNVIELDDKEAFQLSLVENIQRRTLNPLEEAAALRKYVHDLGYGGVSELARRIGKSQEYITRRIQLLELPPKVKDELMRCRITVAAAQELHPLQAPEAEKFVDLITSDRISSKEIRSMVKHHLNLNLNDDMSGLFFSDGGDLKIEKRVRGIDRVLSRCVASLRLSLMRFDETLSYLDSEEWIVNEILMEQRRFLHHQLDQLLILKSKLRRDPHFGSTEVPILAKHHSQRKFVKSDDDVSPN
jgi:ParB family transcriptional regulator, chromosome partitioning protein